MSSPLAHLGTEVQSAGKAAGLTLEQLATRAGVSASQVAALECGERTATLEALENVAVVLERELVIGLHKPGSPR